MSGIPPEVRILIADNHAMFREAVRNLVEQEADLRVIGEASNGREALEMASRLDPDVLLLNLAMPHFSGLEVLQKLANAASPVRTIVFADPNERRQTVEALKLGARGVLCRHTSAQLLFKSIRAVASGEYWVGHGDIHDLIDDLRTEKALEPDPALSNGFRLTPREVSIVGLIVDGCTNRDIARRFSISEQTVKHHLTSIFEKVGVSNRLELALHAMNEQSVLQR